MGETAPDGDGSGTGSVPGLALRQIGPLLDLTLASPPRNLLTADLRAALWRALDLAEGHPEIRGIVLRGAGGQFSSGLDAAELAQQSAPAVGALCSRIERFPKCVVAAIDGPAIGAGMELALAAHYRIGTTAARLGLPGVTLGLPPVAGATQRLPRLIGAEQAIRLLLTGAGVGAGEAVALGLLDRVAESGLVAAAAEMALTLPVRPTGAAVAGMRDARAYQAAVAAARSAIQTDPLPAPARIIDCVEAAQLLPLDQGLDCEASAFAELAVSDAAAGLGHAHLALSRASRLPARLSAAMAARKAGGGASAITGIAILGASGAGLALASQAMARGLRVVLADPRREVLVAGLETIAAAQEVEVAAGRLRPEARDADWLRLTPSLMPQVLAGADPLFLMPGVPEFPGHGAGIRPGILLGGLPAGGQGVALLPPTQAGGLAELALGSAMPGPMGDDDPALAALSLVSAMGWRLAVTGAAGPVDRRLRQTLALAVAAEERSGQSPAAIAGALAGYGLGTPPRAGLPDPGPAGAGIVARCLLALANEGARMLDDGTVPAASTVDAVAVGSGLFPRHRGGPMFQADRRGIIVVAAALRELAPLAPEIYEPAAHIGMLLRDGRGFGV